MAAQYGRDGAQCRAGSVQVVHEEDRFSSESGRRNAVDPFEELEALVIIEDTLELLWTRCFEDHIVQWNTEPLRQAL